jgi:hypothetical protein
MAENCCVALRPNVTPTDAVLVPQDVDGCGPRQTATDSNIAEVTVNSVLPGTPAYVAVIVLVPAVSSVARPVAPPMVATAGVPEVQVAEAVTFPVVLSA